MLDSAGRFRRYGGGDSGGYGRVGRVTGRWPVGRGDAQREWAELEHLDQTAVVLRAAVSAEGDRMRVRQEASWRTRIEAVLEGLAADERERAAEQLRVLLVQHAPQRGRAWFDQGDGSSRTYY